ncbi:MAG: Hpt domain-containing protein, partial [Puniceicoccales bacterium]
AGSILADFLEKSEEELQAGVEAIEKKDWAQAKSIFHKMAGSSFTVRAEDLAQREREVEHYVQEEEIVETVLSEKLDRVTEALKQVKKIFEKTDWESL